MFRGLLIPLLTSGFVLVGCSYSIKDIDVSDREPECVRECSETYSECVSKGPSVGLKTETLRACRESYEICINTCPKE